MPLLSRGKVRRLSLEWWVKDRWLWALSGENPSSPALCSLTESCSFHAPYLFFRMMIWPEPWWLCSLHFSFSLKRRYGWVLSPGAFSCFNWNPIVRISFIRFYLGSISAFRSVTFDDCECQWMVSGFSNHIFRGLLFFFFSGQINPLTCQNFHMISFAPQLFRFYGKMLYLFPDGLVKKNAIFIIIIVAVVIIIIIFCSVLTEAKSVIRLNLPWSPRRFHTTYAFLWWLHVWVCIWFSYMAAPSSL